MAKKTPSKQKSTQQLMTVLIVLVAILVVVYFAYQGSPSAQVLWGD